jgi:hypothetical protein
MKVATWLIGAAALTGAALATVPASAMPNGPAQHAQTSNVEQVRRVCGPFRCWWRPNFYGAYGFYGPPRFFGVGGAAGTVVGGTGGERRANALLGGGVYRAPRLVAPRADF